MRLHLFRGDSTRLITKNVSKPLMGVGWGGGLFQPSSESGSQSETQRERAEAFRQLG